MTAPTGPVQALLHEETMMSEPPAVEPDGEGVATPDLPVASPVDEQPPVAPPVAPVAPPATPPAVTGTTRTPGKVRSPVGVRRAQSVAGAPPGASGFLGLILSFVLSLDVVYYNAQSNQAWQAAGAA
jgi:hypothetical protein